MLINSEKMLAYAAFLFMLLSTGFHTSWAVGDGLLPNGDFRDGPKPYELNGTEVLGKYAIPNWEISGFVEYIPYGHKQGDMQLLVPEGAYAVRLGNDAFIKQCLHLSQGSFYAISLTAVRTCSQDEQLNISVSPEWSLISIQTVYSSNGWDSYAWGFQAKASWVELVIHNNGVDEDPACGPLVDSIAIQILYPPPLTKNNMIKNGDFEEGPYLFANTSWGVLIPPMTEDLHSPLPGWIVESLKAVKYIDSRHYLVPQGKRAVQLIGGRETALAQIVSTTPGQNYSLTFAVGDAADGCYGYMLVEVYAGRRTLQVPYESNGNGGFTKAALEFSATEYESHITFLSSNYNMKYDGTLCGPIIDDIVLVSAYQYSRKLL